MYAFTWSYNFWSRKFHALWHNARVSSRVRCKLMSFKILARRPQAAQRDAEGVICMLCMSMSSLSSHFRIVSGLIVKKICAVLSSTPHTILTSTCEHLRLQFPFQKTVQFTSILTKCSSFLDRDHLCRTTFRHVRNVRNSKLMGQVNSDLSNAQSHTKDVTRPVCSNRSSQIEALQGRT